MLADLADKRLLEFAKESFSHLFCNCYLIDIDTYLSGIGELEERNLSRSILEVGILADDTPVARLTAKFESHGCKVLRGFGQHMFAHSR